MLVREMLTVRTVAVATPMTQQRTTNGSSHQCISIIAVTSTIFGGLD